MYDENQINFNLPLFAAQDWSDAAMGLACACLSS